MFWNKKENDTGKKPINTDEYAGVLKRIAERDTDISLLKSEVKVLQNDLSYLNRKFNSKLRELKKEALEEVKEDNEKFNNDPYLPFG
jgi:archaellum component FlaC